MMRRIIAAAAVALGLLAACAGSDTPEGGVVVARVDGTVGPIMERYIDRVISDAEERRARLVVLELDTPGGLDSSMRKIVQRIGRADVPVAVYVAPIGARAASAGTFITMAGHIAAMAPNTAIGAAAAINADGSDIEGTLGKKIENDAVAYIRGIAELRGRNADWAEQAVREAVAVNENEAARLNVVDFVAADLDDLLRKAEGRTVTLRPGVTATLTGLADAPRVDLEMTPWERFLAFIADPAIASLLLSIGFLALIIELYAPGLGVPGVAGAIAIILGFLGFGLLPVDTAGLVLIGLGLALVAAELFVTSGILGAAGAVAIVLGGIIAFRDTPADFRPPAWAFAAAGSILAAVVLLLFAVVFFADRASRRARSDPFAF
ncbi:nodulation protein NfeD [Tepidiforma sp.]|jgi:membrane-bound serine protease (ClpP class)|uniref:NfeD family protein n=1 Tax=Tepidiforma sp. TaxID=2682230 RepID=UPI002611D5DA|nr:nodulation protein NfeD [Tepidiforma sp.]MCX7616699.1 nodulation protein NfeD [Tepidiforma sp.]